jgi:hypothetical protein
MILYNGLSLQTVWTRPMQLPNAKGKTDTCPRFQENRCDICGKQYVGETGNALNIRMNNHRTSIRSTSGQSQHKIPVGRHFLLRNHGITTFTIVSLENNTNWSKEQRKHKKKYWIYQMHTMTSFGMNEDI